MRHHRVWLALATIALVATGCGSKVAIGKLTRASGVEASGHHALVAAPAPAETPVVESPAAAATGQLVPAPSPATPVVARRGRNAIAIIEIPKIGLRQPVFEGVSLAILHYGPGHWPGTAMFGHLGNAVVAGHRITNTRPFFDIDLLSPGDQIFLTTDTDRFVYEMTEHLIVRSNDTWIADDTPDAMLTLFGCHPKGSKSYRYVVRARLTTTPLPRSSAPAQASSEQSLPDDGPPSGPPPADASPETSASDTPPPASEESPPPQCNSLLCRFGRRAA